MKTVDRYLCPACVQDMRKAQMTFMKASGAEDEDKQKCDFCKKPCFFGGTYKILYDRRH